MIVLLVGDQPDDVLFLQVKEAGRSVLEEHLPQSRYGSKGRRVVEGQRLMQSASDLFLGWCSIEGGHDYYWRQLKDWKGSVDVDGGSPTDLERYAGLCGFALARAHAVTGDPVAIAAYLGTSDAFDTAMGEFALRYADRNEADYQQFRQAIADGRLQASGNA